MSTPNLADLRKTLPQRERRLVPTEAGSIEVRAEDGAPKIAMFVPFNRPSVELFGFTEVIAPGAFARTLNNSKKAKADRSDVVALWNHDPAWVLGRQSNETLALKETDRGLEGVVTLDAEDAMHQHFARRIQRRDVQGSSFGFETVRDEWKYDEDGRALRTLLEVKLFDISPVTYPAYPDSAAEGRAMPDPAAGVWWEINGMDLTELAAVLRSAAQGKVPQAARETLRSWLQRLEGFVPDPPAPVIDWARKLVLRERKAGLERRRYVRPTDGKAYASFEACVADNQWADSPEGYCQTIKVSGH